MVKAIESSGLSRHCLLVGLPCPCSESCSGFSLDSSLDCVCVGFSAPPWVTLASVARLHENRPSEGLFPDSPGSCRSPGNPTKNAGLVDCVGVADCGLLAVQR